MLRWTSLFSNRLPKGLRRKRRCGPALTRRLSIESLEDRRMLAVLTVNTDADNTTSDDDLTLREAILLVNDGGDANAALGRALTAGESAQIDTTEAFGTNDTIEFDIAGAGPHTISPTSVLPTISQAVTIDGYTQPGATANTNPIGSSINADLRIVLSGTLAGAADGLRISAGDSTIRGLVINQFTDDGIQISANGGNTIEGNFIGTDVTGEIDLGNGDDGIFVSNIANNTIGGTSASARNLVSGNNGDGVHVNGASATGNMVIGNFIGTDKDGDSDLGNSADGVHISGAANNTVGGATTTAWNVISANNDDGVEIADPAATGNVVLGNFIGTDLAGAADLGNNGFGVNVNDAPSNTIGGATTGARNVISGNSDDGVTIVGSSATGNMVLGNFIGLDINGATDLGNSGSGILIDEAPNNTVGGTAAGSRNLISGNDNHGVFILGNGADGNSVLGNYIGTDFGGTIDLGNSNDGVFIDEADNNTIGGTAEGAGNLIAGNNQNGVHIGDGVFINGGDATGNMVQGNLIGTDVNGAADLGNSGDGVFIEGVTNNTIGGTTEAARNVISGNNNEGVRIDGVTASGNIVQGNFIGTDISGTGALGNSQDGVEINAGDDNLVGGVAAGAGNVIAFNGSEGVEVQDDNAMGNAIRRNSIFSNSGLGIDLGANGQTPNDANDPDSGPNNLQNFPEFVGNAILVGNSVELTYSVPSVAPFSTFPLDIEFFVADVDMEEGQTYFASDVYSAAEAPNSKMITIPAIAGLANGYIVATATDANGNTSEFSAPVLVAKAPDRFEVNNSIADATVLGSEPTVIERDLSIHEEADEDFFKITAHDTGKLIIRTLFTHDEGDLQLEVQDMFGNVIAMADNSSSIVNMEEVIIPVVAQEMYFVHVSSVDGLMACYDLEIENFAAPVPEMPVLHPDDDHGVSGTDNITSVKHPRIIVQADLTDFAAMGIDILTAVEAEDGETPGAAVEVFINGVSQGFAEAVGSSNTLFQFQLDGYVLEDGIPLDEGFLNFITAAVRMFDGQGDDAGEPSPASGRTSLSKPLELVTIKGGAQIGVWAAGTVLIDSNGNLQADPQVGPLGDGDTAYRIGFDSDYIFAGKFSFREVVRESEVPIGHELYESIYPVTDTIAAYGRVNGNQYRWLIDIEGNGVADLVVDDPANFNGYPVAGNFDGNPENGDEVGLFDGTTWYFDTDHDFNVDTTFTANNYSGFPIAGDFDGDFQEPNGEDRLFAFVDFDNDGDDDVATYIASSSGGNVFSVDLNTADPGDPIQIDGFADFSFQVGSPSASGFGFAGVREKPVAADFNGDGIDDFGLFVPDGINPVPHELAEWYLLISGDDLFTETVEVSVLDRIQDGPLRGFVPFSSSPFGNDIYTQFGNTFSLPIAGNFVPQIDNSPSSLISQALKSSSTSNPPISAPIVEPTKKAQVVEVIVTAPVEVPALADETPVEEKVEVSPVQLIPAPPPKSSVRDETRPLPSAEKIVEQPLEIDHSPTPVSKLQESSPRETAVSPATMESTPPKASLDLVEKPSPEEPELAVAGTNVAKTVDTSDDASTQDAALTPTDPPVKPRSRSRVRSLSFGGGLFSVSATSRIESPTIVEISKPESAETSPVVEENSAPAVSVVLPPTTPLVESSDSASDILNVDLIAKVFSTADAVQMASRTSEQKLLAVDAAHAALNSQEIGQRFGEVSDELAREQIAAWEAAANQTEIESFSRKRFRSLHGLFLLR